MKHVEPNIQMGCEVVAPCAGAWIETASSWRPRIPTSVAPCAGAWIETRYVCAHDR